MECLAWPHKGFSIIKHTKINSELHGLPGFASSCTKQGYQIFEKPTKNNTELHYMVYTGVPTLKAYIRATLHAWGGHIGIPTLLKIDILGALLDA